MNLYTIGFTQKRAETFFNLLKENKIKTVVDIRLNNKSQLAGFSKGEDLKYFLNELCEIQYIHDIYLAPTKEILNNYKNKKINWQEYEKNFHELLDKRKTQEFLDKKYKKEFDGICFLCSEPTADQCHRRLVVEYIKECYPGLAIDITHL